MAVLYGSWINDRICACQAFHEGLSMSESQISPGLRSMLKRLHVVEVENNQLRATVAEQAGEIERTRGANARLQTDIVALMAERDAQAGEIERLKDERHKVYDAVFEADRLYDLLKDEGPPYETIAAERDALTLSLADQAERADANWESCERIKRKFEEATLSLEAAQRQIDEEQAIAVQLQNRLDKVETCSDPVVSSDSAASGISLISAERSRQVSVEGWNPAHDASETAEPKP